MDLSTFLAFNILEWQWNGLANNYNYRKKTYLYNKTEYHSH